jgi:hypothetical protein
MKKVVLFFGLTSLIMVRNINASQEKTTNVLLELSTLKQAILLEKDKIANFQKEYIQHVLHALTQSSEADQDTHKAFLAKIALSDHNLSDLAKQVSSLEQNALNHSRQAAQTKLEAIEKKTKTIRLSFGKTQIAETFKQDKLLTQIDTLLSECKESGSNDWQAPTTTIQNKGKQIQQEIQHMREQFKNIPDASEALTLYVQLNIAASVLDTMNVELSNLEARKL